MAVVSQVRELRASLSDRAEEVGELKLQAEKRAAELAAENIELQSRRREEETARVCQPPPPTLIHSSDYSHGPVTLF